MLSHSVEPSGAHPVGAVFVFLDLLEGDPKSIAELSLGQAKFEAALADAPAHILIYIRRYCPK